MLFCVKHSEARHICQNIDTPDEQWHATQTRQKTETLQSIFLFNSFLSQGNLSELGKLLMQGSFSVWTEHKKGHAKVKDLARFKPMQRHLFLHEKALLFCKRREENGEGYEKAPSYSFKHSLSVSTSTDAIICHICLLYYQPFEFMKCFTY